MLLFQHLHVSQSLRVINDQVNEDVADRSGAALLPLARDAVPNPSDATQLFRFEVDEVARRLSLIALYQRLGSMLYRGPKRRRFRALVTVENEQ